MSVYDAIQDGVYKNTLNYPVRPIEPAVMKKRARDLTPDEIATFHDVATQYEADKAAYSAALQVYRAETSELTSKLQADLEAENGMVGHPKATKVWIKAWEDGHSAGYGEVASIYADLAELVL